MITYEIAETGNIKNLPGPRTFNLAGLEQAKTRAAGMQCYSDTVMVVRCNGRTVARRHRAEWEIVR